MSRVSSTMRSSMARSMAIFVRHRVRKDCLDCGIHQFAGLLRGAFLIGPTQEQVFEYVNGESSFGGGVRGWLRGFSSMDRVVAAGALKSREADGESDFGNDCSNDRLDPTALGVTWRSASSRWWRVDRMHGRVTEKRPDGSITRTNTWNGCRNG